jgi:putative ubiquitin-RnfH superfamily antitoxin RatB of RatAB toxin-antitoxin module
MAADREVVEVVYALPSEQFVVEVTWQPGLTAEGAVRHSGLLEKIGETASKSLKLGIYGRAVRGSQALRPGDRVEIGRPLCADPRAARHEATLPRIGQAQEAGSGSTLRSTRTTRSPSK